jgi:endonuclease/exonuclease/phosphatase (EEP) superfamily protein YafD
MIYLAAVLAAAAVAGSVLRHVRGHGPVSLGFIASAPYLVLGAPLALVVLVIGRQWLGAVLAAALTAVLLVPYVPLYVATTPPRDGRALMVMTANLRLGLARPDAVVAEVREHRVEVLMLQELTLDEQDRLVAAGLDELLPYRESLPGDGAAGTGLWSRYPLRDVEFPTGYTFAFVVARVAVPGMSPAPTAVALHMAGPVPNAGAWTRDIDRLPETLRSLAHEGPVLVGGDFNATPDVVQFRNILSLGYRDAADQAGAGITRSFPSDRWYPPLIAIDHVVTRDAVATSVRTIEIPGSDHRALLVAVTLAR